MVVDWAEDQRLATNQGRIEERERFFPELVQRVGALTRQELLTLAEQARFPVLVATIVDWTLFNQSGGLVEIAVPGGKCAQLPKLPLQQAGAGFA